MGDENQTILQIQKWVETLKARRGGEPIGDWVIAERVTATRGEPIGPQKVEVPYWRATQNRFTLLSEAPSKSRVGRRLLSKCRFRMVIRRSSWISPAATWTIGECDRMRLPARPRWWGICAAEDVLLLMPDGTLAAYNSAIDAADPQRISRLNEHRNLINEVLNRKVGK